MYGSCCTGSVERYEYDSSATRGPHQGEWQPCAPLLTPRRLHGAACCCGRLYVFGGSPGNGALEAKVKTDLVECYLPDEDRWEPRKSLPRPMNVSAVACGKLIFVLPYGDDPMLCYNPEGDSYRDICPLPLPNFHCFAVCPALPLPGGTSPLEFYVLGGTTEGRWTNAAWRFVVSNSDTGQGAWHALPAMTTPRRRTAAAVVMAR